MEIIAFGQLEIPTRIGEVNNKLFKRLSENKCYCYMDFVIFLILDIHFCQPNNKIFY